MKTWDGLDRMGGRLNLRLSSGRPWSKDLMTSLRVAGCLASLLVLLGQAGKAVAQPAYAPTEVRYLHPGDEEIRFSYYHQLLARAMQATVKNFGLFHFKKYQTPLSSKRLNSEAVKGELINVHWSDVGHPELDQGMIPVAIPAYNGALGYRALFIRQGTQAQFSAVRSLAELRQLSFGMGSNWGDIKIYQANGLMPVLGQSYLSLFDMLANRRFDAFPRGINEIGQEWKSLDLAKKGLQIEAELLLYYPFPVYFYVSKNSPRLAERLRAGLDMMLKDGSLKLLFFGYHEPLFKILNLNQRRIIALSNPYLPAFVPPPDDRVFWFDPKLSNQSEQQMQLQVQKADPGAVEVHR